MSRDANKKSPAHLAYRPLTDRHLFLLLPPLLLQRKKGAERIS